MKLSTTIAALAATTTSAQLSTFAAGDGISYSISIPQETAQSGTGDFFFQLTGPTTNQWIAMGVGGPNMAGSMIFVMWEDGTGNVTVSPRLGVGNVQPVANPQAIVTLLEGSGVDNGTMTANVRCSNCSTWSGGYSIDYTSSSQGFLHAYRTGDPIDSTSTTYSIYQHQNNGIPFTFDLTQATSSNVTSTSNPFITSDPASGGVEPTTTTGGGSTGSSIVAIPGKNLLIAHGVIMALTVVLLLPIGALIMRLFSVPWWLHGSLQMIFLALFTAGWGLGYVEAGNLGLRFTGPGLTHTVFGTVIFALLWVQPLGGYLHHLMFKKTHKRTVASHGHIWFGRALLICAIVNGGLGLKLAQNSKGGEIAYGVVSGVVGVIYILGAAWGEMRRAKKIRNESPEQREKNRDNGRF